MGKSEAKAEPPLVTAINALRRAKAKDAETARFSMFSIYRHGRICSLFTIHDQIPKLDVAGSTPVSRSIFSKGSMRIYALNGADSSPRTPPKINRIGVGSGNEADAFLRCTPKNILIQARRKFFRCVGSKRDINGVN